jgi:hypothetical protein
MLPNGAERLLEIGSGYRRAKVLLAAVELGLFSVLACKALDAPSLAGRLGISTRAARDFFDALVALQLLTRDCDGLYHNAPECEQYLDMAKPTYLGASFQQYNRREYALWGCLTDALRTGKPPVELEGKDHFRSLYEDPARFRIFVDAMTSGSLLAAQGIAHQFSWHEFNSFCDIGTAQGCLPVQVARAHPHLRGIGFDLAPLQPAFETYVRQAGFDDRLRFTSGDFFKDRLPAADVLVFGRVLHNWDLKTKKMLLEKAYQAVPGGGAVVIYDMLIDDDRSADANGLLSSLNMLVWTANGFGYTAADCLSWMAEAGFAATRVERLPGGNSMIVARRH